MQRIDIGAYIACPACDLLHRRTKFNPGTTARCTRCETVLYRDKHIRVDRPLSFVLASLILFFVSNYYPFLSLKIEGRTQDTVLFTGVMELYGQGQLSLAVLVLITGMIFPLLQLGGLIYVLFPIWLGVPSPYMATVYRWVRWIQPWSMMEILMLGILVSLVKLSGMAGVVPGPALFAFMALIFILPAATVALDADSIWKHSLLQIDR